MSEELQWLRQSIKDLQEAVEFRDDHINRRDREIERLQRHVQALREAALLFNKPHGSKITHKMMLKLQQALAQLDKESV